MPQPDLLKAISAALPPAKKEPLQRRPWVWLALRCPYGPDPGDLDLSDLCTALEQRSDVPPRRLVQIWD
jgi:hypothetical protein